MYAIDYQAVNDRIYKDVIEQADQLFRQVNAQVYNRVRMQIEIQVWRQVSERVRDQVYLARDQVLTQAIDGVRNNMHE